MQDASRRLEEAMQESAGMDCPGFAPLRPQRGAQEPQQQEARRDCLAKGSGRGPSDH